jgi:hypothetical protein
MLTYTALAIVFSPLVFASRLAPSLIQQHEFHNSCNQDPQIPSSSPIRSPLRVFSSPNAHVPPQPHVQGTYTGGGERRPLWSSCTWCVGQCTRMRMRIWRASGMESCLRWTQATSSIFSFTRMRMGSGRQTSRERAAPYGALPWHCRHVDAVRSGEEG